MAELEISVVTGGPLRVNTYVVGEKGGAECLLIDPGAKEALISDAVCGRRVSAILLTHAHFDHILCAAPWLERGARLYVHELDAPALGDPAVNLSEMIGTDLSLRPADILLHEGDVVTEAGVSLTVLHTPGHTPGGVCYQTDGVLFSGDTLFYQSYGRIDLPGGNERQMAESLARLMQLDGETLVYPGHGMKTKIVWERRNYA